MLYDGCVKEATSAGFPSKKERAPFCWENSSLLTKKKNINLALKWYTFELK
jgi:hypothetical protein